MDEVDFSSGWDQVWSAISGSMGDGLTDLLTVVGVILVIFAIITWLWQRRRGGGGGGGGGLVYMIIIGAILAAPGAIIPAFLTIIDLVVNAALNLIP